MPTRRLGAIALCLGLSACGGDPERPNIVLISVDTLRADHLGAYGHPGDISPALDRLASEGVRFSDVISPVPLTLPAHSSMLSGTIPPVHGVHDNLSGALSDDVVTLAEVLRDAGYATGAVVSSFVLDNRFNLDQGFESYDDTFRNEHKIAFLSERKGDEAAEVAIEWLDRAAPAAAPFFLFLHFYDPHDDYEPPEPYASRFPDDPYAGEVAFTDEMIERVVDRLRELDVYDSTIIAVTADHGEMLGEHGESTHGYFIYRNAVRVPLIIKAPGLPAGVVDERASLVDVAPTLAGLAGLGFTAPIQGRDLLSSPSDPSRAFYVESVTPNRYYGTHTLIGLVARNWKYIHTTRPELYNVSSDPEERADLASSPEQSELVRRMRSQLQELLQTPASSSQQDVPLDEEARERLSALGYLSTTTGRVDLSLDADREDPKDWIDFYQDHQRLEKLTADGAFDEARALAERMLERRPSFVAGHFQLAKIATETGDLAGASASYERALEIDPDNAGAHYNLGNLLRTLGRVDDATEHYERATALDPSLDNPLSSPAGGAVSAPSETPNAEAVAHHQRGLKLRDEGKLDAALLELEAAARLAPELPSARNDLGVVLKQLGRNEDALRAYEAALELDPLFAEAHNNIGSLMGARGDVRKAREHFRRAVAADPEHAQAQNNLGLAIRMTGGRDEAIPHFRAALRARPGWPAPMNELAWILATHPDPARRSPQEAVTLARRAVELTGGRQPVFLDTLAAAHAAAGDFEAAQTEANRAIAGAAGTPGLAQEIEGRMKLYRASRPYVEPDTPRR